MSVRRARRQSTNASTSRAPLKRFFVRPILSVPRTRADCGLRHDAFCFGRTVRRDLVVFFAGLAQSSSQAFFGANYLDGYQSFFTTSPLARPSCIV